MSQQNLSPLSSDVETATAPAKSRFALSLDVWAVVLSLGLALLVRSGIIKSVGW